MTSPCRRYPAPANAHELAAWAPRPRVYRSLHEWPWYTWMSSAATLRKVYSYIEVRW